MTPALNPLLAGIEPPPILEAHGWAARYDGALGPSLDMCQAVPGYPPHPALLQHLANASSDPASARYGLINGDLPLREAYAAEVSAVYGGQVAADQIAITAGCNQAFFLSLLTLAQRGDNVLLPTPWFWNHQQSCTMLGIEPRPLPCRPTAGFVPDPRDAAGLIDDRTRAIVLISPNNPTGAVYPPEVIGSFHDLCAKRGITLILDETYRDFLPEGQESPHGLFARPGWQDNLVQLYSFSKAYCVPGHRLGAVIAARPTVTEFTKALDCLHICPQRPAQAALLWGIAALPAWRAANRVTINDRAAAVRTVFAGLPDWQLESLGAYFAYVRHPCPDLPAARVAERLATERGVVGLPGSAFGPGQQGHLRLAFANLDLDGIAALGSRLGGLAPNRPTPQHPGTDQPARIFSTASP